MRQGCTVCDHTKRVEIEAAIIAGMSYRDIARQFCVGSKDVVARHKNICLRTTVQETKQSQVMQSGSSALDRMARGEKVVDEIIDLAWSDNSDNRLPELALKALVELRRQVELRAKLEGDLDDHSIAVTSTPEWRELRTILLDALNVHPQAKMAVIHALETYNGQCN